MATTGDPREDQYRRAEARAAAVVERHIHIGAYVFDDPDAYSQALSSFNEAHLHDLESGDIRPCRCGDVPATYAQPLFVAGQRPNLLSCARCFDRLTAARERERRAAVAGADAPL